MPTETWVAGACGHRGCLLLLPQPSSFTLGLQQSKNVSFTDGTFHIADDRPARLIKKLDTNLTITIIITAPTCWYSLSLSHSRSRGGSPPQSVPGSSRGIADRLWRCLLARCPSWRDHGPDTGTPDARPSRRHCGSAGRWPSPGPDTVKVSRHQWGMTRAYLSHRHALVPGPIPLQRW